MADNCTQAPAAATGTSGGGGGNGGAAGTDEAEDEAEPTAAEVELADEEDAGSLLDGSSGSDEDDDDIDEPAPALAAAPAAARGRGKARGKGAARGGRAAARGGKGGRAGGRGGGDDAKAPKYTWVDVDKHTFTVRAPWNGEERPWLGPALIDLKWDDPPEKWYAHFVASDDEYKERALNSDKYRGWRFGNNMDGPGKRCYDGAQDITAADTQMLDAFLLLTGLDPAVSRQKTFSKPRLAIVGHRGADLFTEERLKMVRKYFHPSDPYTKVEKGKAGYDNLHQVAPALRSLQKICRSKQHIKNGKKKSTDEETVAGQMAMADNLKANCAKYKAAGDGLQADVVCLPGGSLKGFAFRNHSLLPKVTVKGRPDIKVSDTSGRTLWVWYLAGVESGSEMGMDNLYNSVDFSWLAEAGATIVFDIPQGWLADVEFNGDESSKKVEWDLKGVHIVGTLRGNRGSEKAHLWPEKMGKAAMEALRAKPLVPDRVKARVTDDEAQVMTISIFDKKGFQMIDTIHTSVELQSKPRRVFDKSRGKPGLKDVPITSTQNLYNNIMGYVDLDDLLAWFYRCGMRCHVMPCDSPSDSHPFLPSLTPFARHAGRIPTARSSTGGPSTFGRCASAPTRPSRLGSSGGGRRSESSRRSSPMAASAPSVAQSWRSRRRR